MRLTKVIQRLSIILSENKGSMILSGLLLLLVSVLDGIGITSIFPLISLIISGDELPSGKLSNILFSIERVLPVSLNLVSISIFVLTLFIIKAVLKLATRWYIVSYVNKYEDSIINRLFKATLDANIAFNYGVKQGPYINIFTEEAHYSSNVMLSISEIFALSMTVVIYMMICIFISVPLTLSALGVSFMLLLPIQFIAKLAYRYGDKYANDRHDLTSYMIEIKTGIKFVKSLGNKLEIINRRFSELAAKLSASRFKRVFLANSFSIWGEPLGIASILIIIFIGLNYLELVAAEMIIFLVVYFRFVPMVNSLFTRTGELFTYLPSVEKVYGYLNSASKCKERSGGTTLNAKSYDIEFKSVAFGYDDKTILNDVNFTINKNEFVLIKGESGSGKTTIIDLMMGLYMPSSGQILTNGQLIKSLDLNDYRSRIAYMAQDAFIFDDTIIRNICMRSGEVNIEIGKHAASLVAADKFIEAKPYKYYSILGEQGVNLSGGQRQRLALARSITPKPSLLILDEPTNQLDKETEELIFNYIKGLKGKITIILVTHSNDLVEGIDKVFHIKNGTLKVI